MRRFLELYQGVRTLSLPADHFRKAAGDSVVDALLQAQVLERDPRGATYGCDWPELRCFRRVVEDRSDPEYPWMGICGRPIEFCEPRPLKDEDLEAYRASPEQFARRLRTLLRLAGPFRRLQAAYPDTIQLGELDHGGQVRDVLLCRPRSPLALAYVLAERMLALRRSIVLVPTADRVPPDLAQRYAPGGHVVLGFLVDLLDVRGGALVLLPAFEQLIRSAREVRPAFCSLYAPEGSRPLTRVEYDQIAERAAEFDLFLDAVAPRADGMFAASRRRADGRVESVQLTKAEMSVLVELVRAGTPKRARELAALKGASHQAATRAVERARKRVDDRSSARYGWRAFPSVAGDRAGEHRYVFRPVPGLRYAILV